MHSPADLLLAAALALAALVLAVVSFCFSNRASISICWRSSSSSSMPRSIASAGVAAGPSALMALLWSSLAGLARDGASEPATDLCAELASAANGDDSRPTTAIRLETDRQTDMNE